MRKSKIELTPEQTKSYHAFLVFASTYVLLSIAALWDISRLKESFIVKTISGIGGWADKNLLE